MIRINLLPQKQRKKAAGASGGLIFINGLGAISGPVITGWAMDRIGPPGFFWFTFALFVMLFALLIYKFHVQLWRPSVGGFLGRIGGLVGLS